MFANSLVKASHRAKLRLRREKYTSWWEEWQRDPHADIGGICGHYVICHRDFFRVLCVKLRCHIGRSLFFPDNGNSCLSALFFMTLTRLWAVFSLCPGDTSDDSGLALPLQSSDYPCTQTRRGKPSSFTEEPPVHLEKVEGEGKPKEIWGREITTHFLTCLEISFVEQAVINVTGR